MKYIKEKFFIFHSVLVIIMLLYIFYSSSLRERVANYLYDFTMRIKPQALSSKESDLVGISDEDINKFLHTHKKSNKWLFLIDIINKIKEDKY